MRLNFRVSMICTCWVPFFTLEFTLGWLLYIDGVIYISVLRVIIAVNILIDVIVIIVILLDWSPLVEQEVGGAINDAVCCRLVGIGGRHIDPGAELHGVQCRQMPALDFEFDRKNSSMPVAALLH
ncbi:Hypothetical predicted protein [Olea europaea subsp. europaea]|uniref:Uncharacterized protein n=1 Tax=Olea europaea subsp. europaea TaxID=158383 RepID=A0A8S0PNK2_OLEEU|nr:Hypothetical predicted protein [Olea europaea subsp. europaea]